jgi:hypothetical protein
VGLVIVGRERARLKIGGTVPFSKLHFTVSPGVEINAHKGPHLQCPYYTRVVEGLHVTRKSRVR